MSFLGACARITLIPAQLSFRCKSPGPTLEGREPGPRYLTWVDDKTVAVLRVAPYGLGIGGDGTYLDMDHVADVWLLDANALTLQKADAGRKAALLAGLEKTHWDYQVGYVGRKWEDGARNKALMGVRRLPFESNNFTASRIQPDGQRIDLHGRLGGYDEYWMAVSTRAWHVGGLRLSHWGGGVKAALLELQISPDQRFVLAGSTLAEPRAGRKAVILTPDCALFGGISVDPSWSRIAILYQDDKDGPLKLAISPFDAASLFPK
jgi:hypothetical protein